jgi:hypothetical protein
VEKILLYHKIHGNVWAITVVANNGLSLTKLDLGGDKMVLCGVKHTTFQFLSYTYSETVTN